MLPMIMTLAACAVMCVNNAEEDNYGPVDMSLLTALTWQRTDDAKAPITVGKLYYANNPIYNYYDWKWYFCSTASCDTCYRDDTSHAIDNVELKGDTVIFSNTAWYGQRAKITMLTENALVMKYLDSGRDVFRHYERSHRVLVTKGTGINSGKDTVDYKE